MIIIKENERLYLSNWVYNAARIITELETIVENNGGQVKPHKHALVSNRTLDTKIRKIKDSIERVENNGKISNENKTKWLYVQRNDLERLESINNEPIQVNPTYISFVLDGFHYYYQTDDNPFFDFYYHKTPIIDGYYSNDTYLTKDAKKWVYDCFLTFNASDADIKEAANLIFNMLVKAGPSASVRLEKNQRSRKEKVWFE